MGKNQETLCGAAEVYEVEEKVVCINPQECAKDGCKLYRKFTGPMFRAFSTDSEVDDGIKERLQPVTSNK